MTHSTRSAVIFHETLDGREGWTHFFVRSGFPVYVIDPPDLGRAGFPVDAFNKVHAGLEPPATQPQLIHGDSSEWETFWTGPVPRQVGDGNFYGNQMPTDEASFRNWLQPGSIPWSVPVPGGSEQAFIAVLEKIGSRSFG